MNETLWIAFAQLWQVTALIVGVLLVTGLCRRYPHLAYVLWMIVLLKCVTPPVWSSPVGVFSWLQAERVDETSSTRHITRFRAAGPAEEADAPYNGEVRARGRDAVRIDNAGETASSRGRGPMLAVVVWCFGSAILALLGIIQWRKTYRRLKHSIVPQDLDALAIALQHRLGLRGKLSVFVTSSTTGPLIFGLFRPKVFIPQIIVDSTSTEQLELILAHELIHIRRGDSFAGALQFVVQCLWWFHPLVWIANREISRVRERCCDAEVIASLGCTPLAYGRSLLDILDLKHALRSTYTCPGVRPAEVTSQRLEAIMSRTGKFQPHTPLWCWAASFVAAVIWLPGAGIVFGENKELEEGDQSITGRVFVSAFRQTPPSPHRRVLALDVSTGTSTTVAESGICPRVSPTNAAVAFRRMGTRSGIWIANLDEGVAPVQFFDKGGYPVWSPDGRQIITSHAMPRNGGYRFETWRVNANGDALVRVAGIPETDSVHDWSSDGKWLLTVSRRHGESSSAAELYIMQPDGEKQRRLTKTGPNVRPRFPRFSPDAGSIVYARREQGRHSIHVINADGTGDRMVLREKGTMKPLMACWSPDGRHLAIIRCDQGETPEQGDFSVLVTDLDGTVVNQLPLDEVSDVLHPDWS